MKKLTIITWIVIFALILSACTISSKKPKATPTLGVKPTVVGGTMGAIAAATATSMKVMATEQLPTKTKAAQSTAPVVEATKTPQTQASATPLAPTVVAAPTRLTFTSGGNITSTRGEMNSGEAKKYVLNAAAGQILSIEVWSPNGDVYLGITSEDGKELLSPTAKGVRWTGAVPASQDYIFTVSATGGTTSFSIDIVVTAAGVTPTPQPTSETQTTGTPKPTSGSVATGPFDPYTVYGPPTISDPMNGGNVSDWLASDGKLPNTDSIKLWLDNEKFYVIGKRPGWATWWFSPITLKNVYMDMTVETGACARKDSYGMILRGPGHGEGKSYGYIFEFSCDGAFQITRLDSRSPYSAVTLMGWTNSSYILAGSYQRNVLGIKMDGKILTLYANGYQLAEVSDNVYSSGRYGLYIAPDASTDFTYQVVKMAYWILGLKK
jgi:hypothetical protein